MRSPNLSPRGLNSPLQSHNHGIGSRASAGKQHRPTISPGKGRAGHPPRERHHHGSGHHKHHRSKTKYSKHKHRKHQEDKDEAEEEEDENEEEDVAPISFDDLTKKLDDLHVWADKTMLDALWRFETKDYGYCINSITRIIQKLKLLVGLKNTNMVLLEKSPFHLPSKDPLNEVPPEGSPFPFVDDTAKLSYCFYKRAQCHYHLQKFQFASSDITVALGICPTSPLLPQLFLVKGLALSGLQQYVDASKMFLQGLKHSPYDKDLNLHFHYAVKAMKQQYHVFSAPTNGSGGPDVGNPTAMFDLGGSGIGDGMLEKESMVEGTKIKNPEKGYSDRHANSLINRTSGFVRIHDILDEEIKFWATYGVYLAKKEIKTESYVVVSDFKDMLKDIFLHFCEGPDPIEELGAARVEERGKGGRKSLHQKAQKKRSQSSAAKTSDGIEKKNKRRPTLKDAAKNVIDKLAKLGYPGGQRNADGVTVNGLQGVRVDEQKKEEIIANMIKASNEHEAFMPIFVRRSLTGSQFIAACLESGIITKKYGLDNALNTLKHVTRKIKAHENKLNKHHHHSHHHEQQQQEQAEGESENVSMEAMLARLDLECQEDESDSISSESESDSYSSFDSESQSDSEQEYVAEDIGDIEDDIEGYKLEGGATDLTQAYVFASEYTLLFPHFVECMMRIILFRYGPVVPKEILENWKRDQEEWNNLSQSREEDGDDNRGNGEGGAEGGGGGLRDRRRTRPLVPGMAKLGTTAGEGGGAPQIPQGRRAGGSIVTRSSIRRVSNASNVSSGSGRDKRPSHLTNNGRNSALRLGSQKGMGFMGSASSNSKDLALLAVRLRFGFETHLLPLASNLKVTNSKKKNKAKEIEQAENRLILNKHASKLHKIFTHFAQETQTGDLMELSEFVFLVMSLRLIDQKLLETDVTMTIIASCHFSGTRGQDFVTFADFCSAMLNIADYKTYDGVCDRFTRIETFFKNELYRNVGTFTVLHTGLW